ncbi:hypothetical protein L1049_026763 [Liquidambar formosana]|uniref:Origin recognition complex subunit 2 n=1 Tax=Liquidambar formosana TaxID=63359 RepID=A0AAP0NHM4_LIQFO
METHDGDEEEEFGFSRNYFLAKELGGSGKKSSSKLSDIDIVDEQELRAAALNIEAKHEKEIVSLMNSYKSLYSKWVFMLRCGFGLLMYGFGSKKALIEDFAATSLTEYSVIVINGYLPSINIKQVVITLAEVLWDQIKTRRTPSGNLTKVQQPFNSRSMDDLLAFLDGKHEEENDCFVCVVIHNIDGPWVTRLRNSTISCSNCFLFPYSCGCFYRPCEFTSIVGQEDGSYTIQLVLVSCSYVCAIQG